MVCHKVFGITHKENLILFVNCENNNEIFCACFNMVIHIYINGHRCFKPVNISKTERPDSTSSL